MKYDTMDDVFGPLEQNPEFRKQGRLLKPFYDLVRLIIDRRTDLGLTQKELAERAETYQSRISKIEAAEFDIRLSTLTKIAEALCTEVRIDLVPFYDPAVNPDEMILYAVPNIGTNEYYTEFEYESKMGILT